MRKNSIKNERINGEVMRVVSQAIRESKDPRISPMTSVMEVEVAPDLKTCKVWVTVFGDREDRDKTMEGLNSAAGYVRSVVAHELNLRNTPAIRFILDETIEYAINMSQKIDEVTAKDREAILKRGEDPDAPANTYDEKGDIISGDEFAEEEEDMDED